MANTLGFADVVKDFFNSGTGPIDDGPYGGTFIEFLGIGSFPIPVELDVVLGDEPSDDMVDFLSLPEGSYVTVGFRDEVIVDGEGDDIFVTEVANNDERADIFVRGGGGDFVYLGTATGGTTASFDLAAIGFKGFVNEVKIVGLNNLGGSPGYDVVNVRALTAGLIDLSLANTLTGTSARDKIKLGAGADVFSGGGGGDIAKGGGGGDLLMGQKGGDKLFGQKGNDELVAGKGRDLLVGGGGNDMFVFAKADGKNRVRDLDADADMISITSGASRFADLVLEQAGDHVLVEYADTVIKLLDTVVSDVTRDIFMFE